MTCCLKGDPRSRHAACRLVKAKMQKIAVLRPYLRRSAKSDRIEALTLAKTPFIDPEQVYEIYLPLAEAHPRQRLTHQRKRLEGGITGGKIRIGDQLLKKSFLATKTAIVIIFNQIPNNG